MRSKLRELQKRAIVSLRFQLFADRGEILGGATIGGTTRCSTPGNIIKPVIELDTARWQY
ncbi:MAG: hypothetical protein R3C24_14540 [Cyanobacteriota/Melainabacteria group bacterium]